MTSPADDDLLAEQQRFYRARAPEYDEWWERRGRYDRGPGARAQWDEQIARIEGALEGFGARGDVLEIAGGTGWWTQRLATTASSLTVLDGSPETLDINRARVGRADTEYVVADVFSWRPPSRYDVVFFSFWLSHVPRARFAEFWSLVRTCLTATGRVFFIDNRDDPQLREMSDPYVVSAGADLQRRRLSDGSEYRVVKVMYEPDELEALLRNHGWDANVDSTSWFVFGGARPA